MLTDAESMRMQAAQQQHVRRTADPAELHLVHSACGICQPVSQTMHHGSKIKQGHARAEHVHHLGACFPGSGL